MAKSKLYSIRIYFKDGATQDFDRVESWEKTLDKLWLYFRGQVRAEKFVNVRDYSVRESEDAEPAHEPDIHYTTDLSWSKQEIVRSATLYCDEKCFDWITHDVHTLNDRERTEYRYCQKCHTHTTWRNGAKDASETRHEDRTRGLFNFRRNADRRYRPRGGGDT